MERLDREPRLNHLTVSGVAAAGGALRRLAWWEWPAQRDDHVVICVHGLSRQGRDFDSLARALGGQARVLAVDVAGRGMSDWLADPMDYQVPTYAADLAQLVAHVRQQHPQAAIDWVGTSMGGLIGMALAARPDIGLRRLVLNDVGPSIRWEALQRIASYLGRHPSFPTEQAAMDYLASISTGFGPHSTGQWQALSRPMLRERDGLWWLHYDPAIAVPVRALLNQEEAASRQAAAQGEAQLWGLYDQITAPTLLLRGDQSDLLSAATARLMTTRGPKARLVEFPGVGHAPTLVADDQTDAVRRFLLD
ncbi:MAG: alpha/beta fold hydrolase [Gammaproteobacteria bacterium]